MGLYDTVHCKYPLPHHQDAVYQTKDIECLVGGVCGLGVTMSEYEITEQGGLRVRVHEREWRDDPTYPLTAGYLVSVKDWWEDVENAHGDINIYTGVRDERWVEFWVRFTNGTVQSVSESKSSHTPTLTMSRPTPRPDSPDTIWYTIW